MSSCPPRAGRLSRRAPAHSPTPHPAADDSGITLLEVMVSMSLMAVITSIFVGAVIQTYRVGGKSESMADAQANLHQAFSRLDKLARYASSISEPGGTGATRYVELVTSDNGAVVCTQLRLTTSSAAGSLQSRTRRQGGAVSAWSTLASHVTGPAGFARSVTATDGPAHQQLTVTLSVKAGNGPSATSQRSAVTYTALNTSVATQSNDNACATMGRP